MHWAGACFVGKQPICWVNCLDNFLPPGWCCLPCRLPELEGQFGVSHALLEPQATHILASVGAMAVPGLVACGSDALMRLAFTQQRLAEAAAAAGAAGGDSGRLALAGAGAGRLPLRATAAAAGGADIIVRFLSLSYGCLPLVWGATLSHYIPALLEEAG